ncbi:hypothetical protein [Pararhodobacter sp.]|uniref:hypothetical protein n=1 Tax=Pararhodobacter sp. TaxID=2127056 RepID=UPI002FE0D1AE|nr:hypothetical protein [Pseudomonadota bacterium]
MSLSKSFLILGALYLLVGLSFGIFMGATQEFDLAPVHAHINLVGFTLMTLFGIVYRIIPGLAETTLAKVHFWLFQIGAFFLLVLLFALLSRMGPEATLGPIMAVAEVVVLASIVAFLVNLWQKA